MTDEKRMTLLQEYLSSDKSRASFEEEKGLSHSTIYRWLRIFAVEDKPSVRPRQVTVRPRQAVVTDMKKDPDNEDLLQEIARLKEELRSKSRDLKRAEMARDVYERMIVVAEERYGIPIRKKSGAK
jgi:transposase-like protein